MKKPARKFGESKWKSVLLLLLSPILVFGSYLMLEDEPIMGGLGLLLFGLAPLAGFAQLIPNAYYLKLDEEGFEVKSLYRISFTKWSEIKNLKEGSIRGNKMIFFDYTAKHKKWKAGKKLAKFLSGKEGALISNYTIKTSELLELMKEYKRNSSKAGSNPARES